MLSIEANKICILNLSAVCCLCWYFISSSRCSCLALTLYNSLTCSCIFFFFIIIILMFLHLSYLIISSIIYCLLMLMLTFLAQYVFIIISLAFFYTDDKINTVKHIDSNTLIRDLISIIHHTAWKIIILIEFGIWLKFPHRVSQPHFKQQGRFYKLIN